MTTIDESDEGKSVVDDSGETIGTVVDVDNTTAHVEPDPGLTDKLAAKLGWGDASEDTYRLDNSSIDEITEDEIRLGGRR